MQATIIDRWNTLELKRAGSYTIQKNILYPYVSFIPFTPLVKGLSLSDGFTFPLHNAELTWGSTLCISNEINGHEAVYSFTEGLILVIQSTDKSS